MNSKIFTSIWRPIIWAPLYLLTIISMISFHLWNQWAVDYSERVVSELRVVSPNIDLLMPYADRSWLPLPWQPEPQLDESARAIIESMTNKFSELRKEEIVRGGWSRFQTLAIQWDARRRLCSGFANGGLFISGCHGADRMPADWVAYFDSKFGARYFLAESKYGLVFGQRETRRAEFCNVTPIVSHVTSVDVVASHELSAFYHNAMSKSIAPLYQLPQQVVNPGECVSHEVAAYDVEPQVLVSAIPADEKLEAWFFDKWRKYHATWLNDSQQLANMMEQVTGSLEASFCSVGPEGGWAGSTQNQNCENILPISMSVVISGRGDLFFAANYPGFAGYVDYMDDFGRVDRDALAAWLHESSQFGNLVNDQYALANKWSNKSPRFLLGAVVEPESDPFSQGVHVSGLPQTTIYDEALEIPSDGTLYHINGRPIYSVEDIYEALTYHGDSKGIKGLLQLGIVADDPLWGDATYQTRFRFNPSVQQHFDTNLSEWDLMLYGAIPSTSLLCINKGGNCSWIKDQAFAYAKQVDPERYKGSKFLGEIGGMILNPFLTVKAFKWLGVGKRATTLSRVAVAGVSEGATQFGYSWANQAPSAETSVKFEQAGTNAKVGFLFGAAFGAFIK